MAQLAIKGHATRGSEVISLLEMLGGKNTAHFKGEKAGLAYYIEVDKSICCIDIEFEYHTEFYKITVEEFEEKFPYKVGDKVSSKYLKNYEIEKIEWEGCNNRVIYKLQGMGWYNVNELQPYKEETMEERHYKELRMPLDDDDKLATEVTIDGNKILPPNGYLIGKITQMDNGMLVEYVKQKPQYPKTYEECCEILDILGNINIEGYKEELLLSLQQLLICRDAYWKIAGDWKPNWTKGDERKYCIVNTEGNVTKWVQKTTNKFLAFPTEEMRDAFYENFKDLIEQCKELL